jgi:hypothetical protein
MWIVIITRSGIATLPKAFHWEGAVTRDRFLIEDPESLGLSPGPARDNSLVPPEAIEGLTDEGRMCYTAFQWWKIQICQSANLRYSK